MKPHLKLYQKLWYCCGDSVIGMGFSAREAFDDWVFLIIKKWRMA